MIDRWENNNWDANRGNIDMVYKEEHCAALNTNGCLLSLEISISIFELA